MAAPVPMVTTKTIATEIRIACEVERVWAVLTDFAAYARWNPYLVCVEGEARAGAILSVHALGDGATATVAQRIDVVSAAPYCMRWQGGAADRAEFAGDHWFELESAGPLETLFKHYEHFTGARIVEFGPQHEVRVTRNFQRFNEALKAHCEGQR